MTTCPRCKKTIPDGAGACPHDGEPVAERPPAPPPRAVEVAADDLPAGTMVGDYRVEDKLGQGGFGAVYRAIHPLIHKAAAVKILNPRCSADPVMVSRFIAEARVVNQIRHRNIVDIFAFGQLPDGRHYLIMELLDGAPMDQHLRERGTLSFAEAYPLLRGIARALAAAHGAGVIHRDLKPANVFLARDEDAGFFPKLIDFGIAKLLEEEPGAQKTATGAMMGTAYYMSPEQCRGRPIDARADIYAFGALVHVTLTGRKPFEGDSAMDVVMKQILEQPPPMSSVCAAVPQELDAPVLRMLEKDPALRPQSVIEALDALADAARACGLLPSVPSGRGSLTSLPDGEARLSRPVDSAAAARTVAGETEQVVSGDPAGTSSSSTASWRRRPALLFGGAAVFGAAVALLLIVGPLREAPPSGPGTGAALQPGVAPAGEPASSTGVDQPPSVTPSGPLGASGPAKAPVEPGAVAAPAVTAAPPPAVTAASPAVTSAPPVVTPAPSASAPAAGNVASAAAAARPPSRPVAPRDELDY